LLEELTPGHCRATHDHVSLRYILHYAGIRFDDGILANVHVIFDAGATGDDRSVFDSGRAGDADLSHDQCFAADAAIVRYLHEVIDFGAGTDGPSAEIKTDDVTAKITLSDAATYSGIQLGVAVEFAINSGWHIYGQPLPTNYTPVAITFDGDLVTSQQIAFPAATPVEFKELGETLPVYSGELKASGQVLLKQKLKPGEYKLAGTIQFQECSDTVCKI